MITANSSARPSTGAPWLSLPDIPFPPLCVGFITSCSSPASPAWVTPTVDPRAGPVRSLSAPGRDGSRPGRVHLTAHVAGTAWPLGLLSHRFPEKWHFSRNDVHLQYCLRIFDSVRENKKNKETIPSIGSELITQKVEVECMC